MDDVPELRQVDVAQILGALVSFLEQPVLAVRDACAQLSEVEKLRAQAWMNNSSKLLDMYERARDRRYEDSGPLERFFFSSNQRMTWAGISATFELEDLMQALHSQQSAEVREFAELRRELLAFMMESRQEAQRVALCLLAHVLPLQRLPIQEHGLLEDRGDLPPILRLLEE